MKIIISKLPKNNWWGNGTPAYSDNPAMQKGSIPDQVLLKNERKQLINTLKLLNLEVIETPFPTKLDGLNPKHDFVYIRDQFISNKNGDVIIMKFRNPERSKEQNHIIPILEKLELSISELPNKPGLFAEGGEFYLCKKENILFAGNSRTSTSGIDAVAKFLGVTDLIILKSTVFHLDAYFCPVISKEGDICAITCCIEELTESSKVQLYKFADSKNIPIIRLPNIDGIGSKRNLGSFAVNALPIPGFLIGPKPFSDDKVVEKLKEIGIERINTPMSQYALSGGSVHCCTNEIY